MSRPRILVAMVALLAVSTACGPESTPPPRLEPATLDETRSLDPEVVDLVEAHLARVRAAPSDAREHGSLGLVYEANGLWAAAEQSFANAARIDPSQPLWRYHRSIALREAGRTEEAIELLRGAAAELPAEGSVQYRLGHALLDAGEAAGAEAAFSRALQLAPEQPEVQVGLAFVRVQQGRHAEARDLARRALAKDPSYAQAHYVLGLALRGLGETGEAARELQAGQGAKTRQLGDPLTQELEGYRVNYVDQRVRATQLADLGRHEEAARLWERILQKHPEDMSGWSNYGAVLSNLGRFDDALQALNRALVLDPEEFAIHINFADLYLRTSRLADARKHADLAVQLGPQVGATHLVRARVLAASRDNAGAFEELGRALEVDPKNATARYARGELCAVTGRDEEACKWFRECLEVDPDNLPARVNLASLTLKSGDVAAARAQVLELQRIAGDHPRVKALAEKLGMSDRR